MLACALVLCAVTIASRALAQPIPAAILVSATGRDDAQEVVSGSRPAVETCVRARGVGDVHFRLQIRRDGSVGAVRRERGSLRDARVEACVARALRQLRFRGNDRQTVVRVEWRFSTGNVGEPIDPQGHGIPTPSFARRTEAPRIRVGMPEASGGYSAEIVRRILRRNQNQIGLCYERTQHEHHLRPGQLQLRFRIEPDGSVSSAQVLDDSIGSAELATCITTSLRRWAFPAPAGGAIIVTYPLELGPPDRPAR